jgi:hypothetical protein
LRWAICTASARLRAPSFLHGGGQVIADGAGGQVQPARDLADGVVARGGLQHVRLPDGQRALALGQGGGGEGGVHHSLARGHPADGLGQLAAEMILPELPGDVDAAESRHLDVQDGDVGLILGRHGQGLVAGRGLRDDLDVRLQAEQRCQGVWSARPSAKATEPASMKTVPGLARLTTALTAGTSTKMQMSAEMTTWRTCRARSNR